MEWYDLDSDDLDAAVAIAISMYSSDFRKWWGVGKNEPPSDVPFENWCRLLGLYSVARQLAIAGMNLYRPEGLSNSDINLPGYLAYEEEKERAQNDELMESVKALPWAQEDWPEIEGRLQDLMQHGPAASEDRFFRTAVQIALADQGALPDLGGMAANLLVLTGYLTRNDDQKVRRYLARVARCYLLDMIPELCVMARAVLEVALADRMPPEYMRRVRGIASNERIPITTWIDQAAAEGLFDEEAFKAAKRVAERGGQVAHGETVEGTKGEAVLADLHRAVSSLQRRR